MTHIYKAKCYAILKIGTIPVELQEDTIFHCQTDLLYIDIDIEFNRFSQLIGDEWIGLDVLKERFLGSIAPFCIDDKNDNSINEALNISNDSEQTKQLKDFIQGVADWEHDYSSTIHRIKAKELLKYFNK